MKYFIDFNEPIGFQCKVLKVPPILVLFSFFLVEGQTEAHSKSPDNHIIYLPPIYEKEITCDKFIYQIQAFQKLFLDIKISLTISLENHFV